MSHPGLAFLASRMRNPAHGHDVRGSAVEPARARARGDQMYTPARDIDC